jgi:hypothetical protein
MVTSASSIAAVLVDGVPSSPKLAPAAPGFYAWWCLRDHLSDASPPIPYEPRSPMAADWSLLYVGISPSSVTSRHHLAARLIKNHAAGNIGGSTFRQSLAGLLSAGLGLEPLRGSDRSRLITEAPLTSWIERSCRVTFAVVESPWKYEAAVISQLNPPLNLDGGAHPFKVTVQQQRAALRRACGL